MIDVLIVSRLATMRAGLRALLTASPSLQVVGEAATLDTATVASLDPEVGVVLLDASAADEIDDAVASLEGSGPGLVVLGPVGGLRRLTLAAPPFAWAFLAREAPTERIMAAVQAVAAGLVAYEADAPSNLTIGRAPGPLPVSTELDDLTGREREVLTLVAMGLTNKAIAQRLGISEHTVKFHVASILAKLDAESRTEAVHLAVRRGLLTL
jgi:DNA-binding NarL/FixJ family response regulator